MSDNILDPEDLASHSRVIQHFVFKLLACYNGEAFYTIQPLTEGSRSRFINTIRAEVKILGRRQGLERFEILEVLDDVITKLDCPLLNGAVECLKEIAEEYS